ALARDGALPVTPHRARARSYVSASSLTAASLRTVFSMRCKRHARIVGKDDLRLAARYLIANPLRAGLVERVGDYPFWDAIWLP
ncbi:transposase, partial [Xanthomonas sp. WHRI 8393]